MSAIGDVVLIGIDRSCALTDPALRAGSPLSRTADVKESKVTHSAWLSSRGLKAHGVTINGQDRWDTFTSSTPERVPSAGRRVRGNAITDSGSAGSRCATYARTGCCPSRALLSAA